jgi:hypothetical protein
MIFAILNQTPGGLILERSLHHATITNRDVPPNIAQIVAGRKHFLKPMELNIFELASKEMKKQRNSL